MKIEITNEDIAKASNENLATLFTAIVSMARASKQATPDKSEEPVEPANNEEPQEVAKVESEEPVKAEEPKAEPKEKKRQTRKAKQETPVKVEEPKEAPKVEAEPEVEVEPESDEITVPEEPKTITKDELRKYLMKLQENGETAKIVAAFKEMGVKKFSEVKEEQYQHMYDLIRRA